MGRREYKAAAQRKAEAERLGEEVVRLAELGATDGRALGPIAGGITRLGKFEAVRPESRFDERPMADTLNWLADTLHLRYRQGKYRAAAILAPRLSDGSASESDALLEIAREAGQGPAQRYRALVREKRPGALSVSQPEPCPSLDPDQSWLRF